MNIWVKWNMFFIIFTSFCLDMLFFAATENKWSTKGWESYWAMLIKEVGAELYRNGHIIAKYIEADMLRLQSVCLVKLLCSVLNECYNWNNIRHLDKLCLEHAQLYFSLSLRYILRSVVAVLPKVSKLVQYYTDI